MYAWWSSARECLIWELLIDSFKYNENEPQKMEMIAVG